MSWQGAVWSGYANRLKAGIYWEAGRQPTQADPSYPVFVEGWAATDYSSYNFDLTAGWYGQWGAGSVTRRASGSTPLLMVSGWQTFTASYDGEVGFGFGMDVSGTGAGPVSTVRYGSVPRRPTANPSVPLNVKMVAVSGAGKLQLTWNGPSSWPGPSSGRRYQWQISTNSSFTAITSSGYQANGTLPISGTAGVTYWARVRSEGVWWDATRASSWVTVSAKAPSAPVLSAAPNATNVSRNSFVVPVATVSNNGGMAPTNYRLQVNTVAAESGSTTATQGSWAAITVLNRLPETLYYYRVSAWNYAGWGPWTSWKSVTTLDDAPSDPAAPTVSAITETSCTVTWVAPAANGATITGYDVVISDTNNPGTPVKAYSVGATVLSQAVTGLTKAHDYQAYVRAKGTPASSGFSEAQQFRTTGTLATLFPMLNVAGAYRPFELWENVEGDWQKVQLNLNVDGVWKWSEV